MFAEKSGLRGAGAPDCRRLRHDGVVQEALRQRRARQPLAGEAAQFIVTSAVGDDVGDDGQPCAAKAIDVMTRKSCPRFSGGKSYQPRRLSKDVALFIFGHDRFPEPEKIKRVRRDCRPWRTQCLSRKSPRPGCADRRRHRRTHPAGSAAGPTSQASGPERMSGLGVTALRGRDPRRLRRRRGGDRRQRLRRPCPALLEAVAQGLGDRRQLERRSARLADNAEYGRLRRHPAVLRLRPWRSPSSSQRERASCCARPCRRSTALTVFSCE